MKCECYFCSKHRQLSKATRERDIDTLIALAKELGGRAISAEFDAEYHSAILDGNWPQSVEILEQALVRAKVLKEK